MTTEMKRCLLDLVPDTPIKSDVFEFGEPKKKYRFRLLDTAESAWAIAAAQRKVYKSLCEHFEKDIALRLMIEHGLNGDLHTWWQELYALQACLCDEHGAPVVDGSPEERAERIADVYSPIERHELAILYSEFADEHDPMEITPEEAEEIIASEGFILDPDFWKQSGSRTLRIFALILAEKLVAANLRLRELDPPDPETSQTPKSTVG